MEEKISGYNELYGIVSSLRKSGLFRSAEVIELIDEERVKLIKIRAEVPDGSILYITELHTPDFQKYSYHWQSESGQLLVRWDNSPHWKNMRTLPNHKHVGESVIPSHRVDINDVISTLREFLKK